jgi:hypothetical protein
MTLLLRFSGRSGGRIIFPCRHHSTMVLHAHISTGDEKYALWWPQSRDVVSPHRHDHHHHQLTMSTVLYRRLVNWRYTPFLTSAVDGGEWLASLPNRFSPKEKTPVLVVQEGVCSQKPSGRCGERKGSLYCREKNACLLALYSRYIWEWSVTTPVPVPVPCNAVLLS